MISFRTISLPMFALVAALAGCSSDPGTSAGPDTASTAKQEQSVAGDVNGTKGPDGRGPHGHHGPGGPGGPEFLIGAALHAKDIGLNDAQRTTIEALAKRGGPGGDRPEHRDHPAFDQTKAKELATAIRAGNVSSLPKPPGPDASQQQQHIAESAAKLKTLHDTLTADQRAKLVADVQSHAPKAGDKGPGDKGPHGPEMRGGPHGGPGGMPFGDDLNLTDAQKEQLRAKFEANHPKPDFEKMKTEMNTKLESFKADTFDATAFVTPSGNFQPKPDGNPLADLVSVLTPEQRETLAKKIEAGPPAHPAPPQP